MRERGGIVERERERGERDQWTDRNSLREKQTRDAHLEGRGIHLLV